ncbi:hypothetical protein [Sulfurivermis fontis]|uniref:hypothetical protein n=1 Tax=Sulfurivermis fontis TaxID=1972068 RepID=UPI000FD82EE7|nr:hypothetical protein [Sulfurivermis fontis]
MTFALKELSRLLTQDRATMGIVVAIKGSVVRIATERGAVTAKALDALAVGDRVRIDNGIAIKAPTAKRVLPV